MLQVRHSMRQPLRSAPRTGAVQRIDFRRLLLPQPALLSPSCPLPGSGHRLCPTTPSKIAARAFVQANLICGHTETRDATAPQPMPTASDRRASQQPAVAHIDSSQPAHLPRPGRTQPPRQPPADAARSARARPQRRPRARPAAAPCNMAGNWLNPNPNPTHAPTGSDEDVELLARERVLGVVLEAGVGSHERVLGAHVERVVHLPVHLAHLARRVEEALRAPRPRVSQIVVLNPYVHNLASDRRARRSA